MYEIRESTVSEMLALAGDLFAEHWDEIALNKHMMVIKPDTKRYEAMEASGSLFIFAAFDKDGALVGYSVNFVVYHLHYADLCIASNDLLFVSKEHRHGRIGLQLIRATEAKARREGARLVLWHAKPNTPLAEIMPRLGYDVQDITFSREV
jgi:predicted GNAT superfamily acetyltransferase